ARVDAHVAADDPARLRQRLLECSEPSLKVGIVRSCGQQHADAPHAIALLCARAQRPRRRAGQKSDKLAALHSITSSARTSKRSGTLRPSALAVLRLSTVWYLTGTCTGRSAGLSPRKMRST